MANSVGRFPKGSKGAYQDRNSTPPRKPKRISPFHRGFVWGATVSLTAAVSSIVGASIALVSPSSINLSQLLSTAKFPQTNSNPQTSDEGLGTLLQHTLTRPVNILVMGIDRVKDAPKGTPESFAGHSDTMLLVRFDPSDRSVRLLSIPRDSRVEIPGVGYGKVNEANMHGGPAFASRVVSRSLNDVVIDRYVRVTTDAFRELVDLVGGVEVLVPYSMSYRDLSQNLEINLQAGWQTLNGEQAEEFVRFRNDRFGDIGRVQRQQVLLKALQKRLYSPAILPRLPQAMRIFQQYVDTNLTLDEMLALANFGRDLNEQDIRMVMLPGRFSQQGEYKHKSYWIIAQGERDRLIDDYFNRASQVPLEMRESHQVRIAIQNATNDPGLGNRAIEYLAQKDFKNVYLAQESPELLQETEIIVQKGNLEAANSLKSLLGIGRVEALSVGDLDSDLTIRIGLDAKQLLAGDSFLRDTSPLTSPGNENP
ncbi:MAG: LCP family protein [Hydrococcus sp. Prado102]|jgi:LCP family protein required for cell wall assembly|nr:LCP family protein [Hydrococcus sp. Prado102]